MPPLRDQSVTRGIQADRKSATAWKLHHQNAEQIVEGKFQSFRTISVIRDRVVYRIQPITSRTKRASMIRAILRSTEYLGRSFLPSQQNFTIHINQRHKETSSRFTPVRRHHFKTFCGSLVEITACSYPKNKTQLR